MKIEHLIFLIHPLVYEGMETEQPETVSRYNCGVYIERTREVKQRWLAALARQSEPALLLQLYGPEYFAAVAREHLGEANVCYVKAECPGEDLLREYYRRLTQCIRDHMRDFGLDFDPATVTSEIWGVSFEGCAPGYGSAFAEELGLVRPPTMRFEMTVYDSRFLYGAKRWEAVPIAGSDVEAMLFECHDATGATIFQARLTAQWLDKRPIRLQLDPTRIQVCTKLAFTVWPEAQPDKDAMRTPQNPQPFTLTTSDSYWIRGYRMGVDELRQVVLSATVG